MKMKKEDFSLYSEYDPNSKITVLSDSITATNMNSNEHGYVYFDKGINFFRNSFVHEIKFKATAVDAGYRHCTWGLANALGNMVDFTSGPQAAHSDALLLEAFWWFTYWRFNLYEVIYDGGAGVSYSVNTTSGTGNNVDNYLRITRDESIGDYGSLYLDTYSDSGRTTPITSRITLNLHKKSNFRYIYGFMASGGDLYVGTNFVTSNLYLPYIDNSNKFKFHRKRRFDRRGYIKEEI